MDVFLGGISSFACSQLIGLKQEQPVVNVFLSDSMRSYFTCEEIMIIGIHGYLKKFRYDMGECNEQQIPLKIKTP